MRSWRISISAIFPYFSHCPTCGPSILLETKYQVGDTVDIPIEAKHRLENFTKTPIAIIEVQIGSYLGEDDIVRLEDDFGRDKQ